MNYYIRMTFHNHLFLYYDLMGRPLSSIFIFSDVFLSIWLNAFFSFKIYSMYSLEQLHGFTYFIHFTIDSHPVIKYYILACTSSYSLQSSFFISSFNSQLKYSLKGCLLLQMVHHSNVKAASARSLIASYRILKFSRSSLQAFLVHTLVGTFWWFKIFSLQRLSLKLFWTFLPNISTSSLRLSRIFLSLSPTFFCFSINTFFVITKYMIKRKPVTSTPTQTVVVIKTFFVTVRTPKMAITRINKMENLFTFLPSY